MKIHTVYLDEINAIGQSLEKFYRTMTPHSSFFVDRVRIVDEGDMLVGHFRFDGEFDAFVFEPEVSYFE